MYQTLYMHYGKLYIIIIPILQMRQPKFGKVKVICQGHTAELDLRLSDFKAHSLSTVPCQIWWIKVLRHLRFFI